MLSCFQSTPVELLFFDMTMILFAFCPPLSPYFFVSHFLSSVLSFLLLLFLLNTWAILPDIFNWGNDANIRVTIALLCHNYVAFIILKENLLCWNFNHGDIVFNFYMKVCDLNYLAETSVSVCLQHLLRSEYCCFQKCHFMQFCLRAHFFS